MPDQQVHGKVILKALTTRLRFQMTFILPPPKEDFSIFRPLMKTKLPSVGSAYKERMQTTGFRVPVDVHGHMA